MRKIIDNDTGFTLLEILIAMAISLIIMGGAYTVFNSYQRNTVIQTNESDTQQTLRAAMDFLSRDMRMAGYDPQESGNFGISDIKFRNLDDNPSANGQSFIRFSWDRNGDGTLNNDETIDYGLVDNSTITPGVSDLYIRFPNDTNKRDVMSTNVVRFGLAYAFDADNDDELDRDGSGNIIWAVDSNNDSIWDTLNTTTGATTATVIPVDTNTIRAIRIWILVQSLSPDSKYVDSRTYIVGSHPFTPSNHFRHHLLERTILCRNMGL